MIAGLALAWLAILAGGWLGWQLLRQNGRLLLRLDDLEKRLDALEFGEEEQPKGLEIGSEAPAFELPNLSGERKSLAQYLGQPVLLIFFNPACGFCREMLSKQALLHQTDSSKPQLETGPVVSGNGSPVAFPRILIVSTGSREANRQLFDEHKVTHPVLLQKEMELAAAYQANGTPSGYLINPEGKIASRLAIGTDALLKLAVGNGEGADPKADVAGNGGKREDRFSNRSLARSKIKRDGLKAGTRAPDFRLPRLDGRGDLTLSELRGRRVLLVFSSPGCGPCEALAPELEEFHRANPETEVLMVSKGEPRENRAKVKEHNLTFPIVLQQQWETSRLYAMFATPVAYLIDEAGVITSDVAVGADGIQELMSQSAAAATRA